MFFPEYFEHFNILVATFMNGLTCKNYDSRQGNIITLEERIEWPLVETIDGQQNNDVYRLDHVTYWWEDG